MIETITLVNACIFFLLSAIHLYWLVGGQWAVDAAVPSAPNGEKVFHPGPLATLAVAVALILFALSDLLYGGYIHTGVPVQKQKYVVAAIAAVFFLRVIGDFKYIGIFKRYGDSGFAKRDTWIYIPLSFWIALSQAILVICFFV